MIQTESAGVIPRWRVMEGSAVLATDESSTAIVIATAMASIAHQRCGVGRPSG